jgi:hypothetical protein
VLAILTLWVHKLRFLGEGQRYLELSAFPAAFVAAQLFLEFFNAKNPFVVGLYSFIIALCIVTIVVIQRKAIIKDSYGLGANLFQMEYQRKNKQIQ